MLGGYDHVYFLKMLGGDAITSITKFILLGGYPRSNMVNSCPNHSFHT